MTEQTISGAGKPARHFAFEQYLRTGRHFSPDASKQEVEQKFNPYHDPRNGRFTFAPGGPRSLSWVVISDSRALSRTQHAKPGSGAIFAAGAPSAQTGRTASATEAVYRPSDAPTTTQVAQNRPTPRTRLGGNGGPPLNDPMTLERAFPGLTNAPGGSLVALADNILDLTGPANRLTSGLALDHAKMLIRQIKAIDPHYQLESLGFPTTLEGQTNLINQLRVDRAVAFYRIKGELRPLQIEILRLMQRRADTAYIEGQALFESGRLKPRLSREEAIGNYVDRAVRRELRDFYEVRGIDYSSKQQIKVIGREYDTSGSDRTYRIPDARVGNIAFDVTLARKTLATPQVRGFFNSDFTPDIVIIVRPTQLGPNSTYAISRPRK